MRYLEVRRHAERNTSGEGLSERGLEIAQGVGQSLPHYDFVVTTEFSWTYETAVAMGYEVNKRWNAPGYAKEERDEEVSHHASPSDYARLIKTSSGIARWAQAQSEYYRSIIKMIPDEAKALLIFHGGAINAAAIACFPHANHERWGPAFGHCEGYCLYYENEKFVDIKIHRVGNYLD